MRTRILALVVALVLTGGLAPPARALIGLGSQAPNFTKSVLGGGTALLSDYSGKVVVIFLLGYD